MAEILSVACNHCGAPLQVPDTARFVTCTYCGSPLEIKRSGNAAYTEVLASIDQRTQQIAADVEQLKRQSQVEALDREWQITRDKFLVHGEHGQVSEPSAAGGIVGAIVAVVGGVIWTIFAGSIGAPGPFVLFGLLFIVVGVIGGLTSVGAAARYQDAERTYRWRRQQLLSPPQQPPVFGDPFLHAPPGQQGVTHGPTSQQ